VRDRLILICVAGLACVALAQKTAAPVKAGGDHPTSSVSADAALKDMFESKIKAEWDALKNKDKKAYGELLADDYQGVEADGRGERNKIQSVNEVANLNVYNYMLWGYKLIPAGPDAALVIYEVTMQFPPKALVRYDRVYFSELWMKRAGQWKLVHYQETPVK
jgi:hypothetical protein